MKHSQSPQKFGFLIRDGNTGDSLASKSIFAFEKLIRKEIKIRYSSHIDIYSICFDIDGLIFAWKSRPQRITIYVADRRISVTIGLRLEEVLNRSDLEIRSLVSTRVRKVIQDLVPRMAKKGLDFDGQAFLNDVDAAIEQYMVAEIDWTLTPDEQFMHEIFLRNQREEGFPKL